MKTLLEKHKRKQADQILVIEDDENMRFILSDRLQNLGHAVDQASSLSDAFGMLKKESYRLVLLDVYLPDQQGLEGLQEMRKTYPEIPVIIMTAHGTIDLAVKAMKEGAYDFVTKPMDFEHLAMVVKRVIERSRLRSEVDYLRRSADQPFLSIIGERGGLKDTMELVRGVAASDTTVLVRGETGTGKEVIARAIHRLSPRRNDPFIVANCAAIPRELMESEMFGHKRGAFTDAVSDHAGFFETAAAGTLLLDEIGDLNLELQAKILRVLEDGSFRKVGSEANLHNRSRIIASTHQPLETLMEKGRFREDLFYRLNVFPIVLPPLRARKEDILPLAEHFLHLFSSGRRSDIPVLGDGAAKALLEHSWKGNIRELKNCMERLSITVSGRVIDESDVTILLRQSHKHEEPFAAHPLKDLEEKAIRATLERFGGNRTRTAEALGIGRRTLQNKLKQLGISEADDVGEA